MEEKLILVCDGTMDGIFTAVYDGFVLRNERFTDKGKDYRDNIGICVSESCDRDMFAEYISIATDYEKSFKTAAHIRKRLGYEVYDMTVSALSHYDEDRATIVFGFLIRAFSMGSMGKHIVNRLQDIYVMRTMELSRKTSNEAYRFKEFLRFKDMEGTLYGVICPKCDVVPLIGAHFAERYPNENWIIYDSNHKKAAVHRCYGEFVIVSGEELDGEYLKEQYEKREDYEKLWKTFCDAHFIRERRNEKCQNNLLPKWYRKNMTEFYLT